MMRPLARRARSRRSSSRPPTRRRAGRAGADGGQAFFAYCANYLIDLDHAVIVDVEASTAVRQAEVTAAKRMIERIEQRVDLYPERLTFSRADFPYDHQGNVYVCPGGKILTCKGTV
jgi:hypothetical protein